MTEAVVFAREPARAPSRTRLVRGLLLVLVVLAIGGLGWRWWQGHRATQATTAATRSHASDPVPVLVATAAKSNVPIYLDALGTVQAFSTVTIKPMVDGPLLEVRFREGQDVKPATFWRGSIRAPIRRRSIRRWQRRRRTRRQLANARRRPGPLPEARRKTEYTSAQQADTQKATVAQLEAQVGAGPGADRQRPHAAQLHDDHLPDRRPRRHPPGRPGQYRARHRHDRPGGAHAR